MSLHFLKSGLQTTLQDLGRKGHMHQGIPVSGAMDPLSMQLANWLVGNAFSHPVLEITLIGPTIEFTESLSIAIVGAYFQLRLNGNLIFNHQTIQVKQGDVLEFTQRQKGARAYLAFSGQVLLGQTLDSFATHVCAQFGGFHGHAFNTGDKLQLIDCHQVKNRSLPVNLRQDYSGKYILRCCDSVETQLFDETSYQQFYREKFIVHADSNRMGIRLSGNQLQLPAMKEMISSGLIQGSIQIPPSGLPIISSVEGQTIGGYPRIANIISADLYLLGQLKAGDKINFSRLSRKDALSIQSKNIQSFGEELIDVM